MIHLAHSVAFFHDIWDLFAACRFLQQRLVSSLKEASGNICSKWGVVLFWELPALPHTDMERLKDQISLGVEKWGYSMKRRRHKTGWRWTGDVFKELQSTSIDIPISQRHQSITMLDALQENSGKLVHLFLCWQTTKRHWKQNMSNTEAINCIIPEFFTKYFFWYETHFPHWFQIKFLQWWRYGCSLLNTSRHHQ